MTPEYQYQKAVDLATGMARVTTRENVLQVTWLPFQLLYTELVKRKEIMPITSFDRARKMMYWNEAKEAQPNAGKTKLIWLVQAVYVYDLILAA
jgi:hypothetical protein